MARRRHRAPALAVAVAATLGACGAPVALDPAPSAAAGECGDVLQSSPDELLGHERRSTTSQATTAWGTTAITLRCGVEPPAPSTDRCLGVEVPGGAVHDWLSLEADDPAVPERARGGTGGWVFVTYGRVPALEVVVPSAVVETLSGPTDVLVALEGSVEQTDQYSSCVGATDVPQVAPAEPPSASPSGT